MVRKGPHQQLYEKASCPRKPGDALLFQRQSGTKGKEAEKLINVEEEEDESRYLKEVSTMQGQFRKKLGPPVEEEAWDKDRVEFSYSEPASPAHIKGVTFCLFVCLFGS